METLKHSMDWMTISPRILDAHRERQLQQQAFWDEDVVLNRSDRRWKAMELYGNMDSKLQDIPLIFVICPFQSVVKGSWPFWIHLALDLPPGADSFQQGSGASPRPPDGHGILPGHPVYKGNIVSICLPSFWDGVEFWNFFLDPHSLATVSFLSIE